MTDNREATHVMALYGHIGAVSAFTSQNGLRASTAYLRLVLELLR